MTATLPLMAHLFPPARHSFSLSGAPAAFEERGASSAFRLLMTLLPCRALIFFFFNTTPSVSSEIQETKLHQSDICWGCWACLPHQYIFIMDGRQQHS